jgi:hypothetical protein
MDDAVKQPLSLAPASGCRDRWCVALVWATDGLRFLTMGPSRASILPALSMYVREQAHLKLWPEDALRVDQLMAGGALDVAIDLYFAAVGERWDEEWLQAEEIDLATNTTEAITEQNLNRLKPR